MTKTQRMFTANALIRNIASQGRGFFLAPNQSPMHGCSYFLMDGRLRVWFVDSYTGRRIYTHAPNSKWRGFTGGGALLDLVKALARFIQTGKRVPAVHFVEHWGYGQALKHVVSFGVRAGVIDRKSTRAEWRKLDEAQG